MPRACPIATHLCETAWTTARGLHDRKSSATSDASLVSPSDGAWKPRALGRSQLIAAGWPSRMSKALPKGGGALARAQVSNTRLAAGSPPSRGEPEMRFVLKDPVRSEDVDEALHALKAFLLKHEIASLSSLIITCTALREGSALEAVDRTNTPRPVQLDAEKGAMGTHSAVSAEDAIVQRRRPTSLRTGLGALLSSGD